MFEPAKLCTLILHMKQAELDYQDYMIISDSEFEITDEYLIFKYKLDN